MHETTHQTEARLEGALRSKQLHNLTRRPFTLAIRASLAFLAILTMAATPVLAQSATPIPKLDLNRLTGTWFELAHLPDKSEKDCVSNATVLYALGDKPGRLQVVATCLLKDGASNVRNKDARLADKMGDGKLKIPGFLPYFLAKKSWVVGAGAEYEWLLVGSPNHKTLRILSKTQTLPPATLSDLQSRAAAQGYPVAKLIQVPQTQ